MASGVKRGRISSTTDAVITAPFSRCPTRWGSPGIEVREPRSDPREPSETRSNQEDNESTLNAAAEQRAGAVAPDVDLNCRCGARLSASR